MLEIVWTLPFTPMRIFFYSRGVPSGSCWEARNLYLQVSVAQCYGNNYGHRRSHPVRSSPAADNTRGLTLPRGQPSLLLTQPRIDN